MADLPELRAETEQNRLDFLRIDLDLCFTFVSLAVTELLGNDKEEAACVLGKAEQGYTTIKRFLADVRDESHYHELDQRLTTLRARLDDVTRQISATL